MTSFTVGAAETARASWPDLATIALWLGHATTKATAIYLVCRELHQMGEPNTALRQLAA